MSKICNFRVIDRMKPCRVTSMALGRRPATGRITPCKSEPKLYCKPLIPSTRERERRRMSTVDLSTTNRRPSKPREEVIEERKMELLT